MKFKMTLEDQAEQLSNRYGHQHSKVYDLLMLSNARMLKNHPVDYFINNSIYSEKSYRIVERLIRFQTYMSQRSE